MYAYKSVRSKIFAADKHKFIMTDKIFLSNSLVYDSNTHKWGLPKKMSGNKKDVEKYDLCVKYELYIVTKEKFIV